MQRWFLPFLSTLLLLQGCVAAALVGTAAVGTKVSVDP
ncbi:osmotically-inducible protein OsmY, partial [Escherichia coli]|nr:osmotically-inducible protein OsmY [Escherichia coli]